MQQLNELNGLNVNNASKCERALLLLLALSLVGAEAVVCEAL